jgi:AraC-like DNA-binding protein
LNALQEYASAESVGYTRQENYIKINFWLSGKHTTVLDGFGQNEHDRPQVLITAGPQEMVKVDLFARDTQIESVAFCMRREFFAETMRVDPDQLPDPLRQLVKQDEMPFTFHRMSLTPALAAAARAILAAPPAVRRQPVYLEAKATEVMCLLINRLEMDNDCAVKGRRSGHRRESRLYEAREFLRTRYADTITLERLSRDVGLNKMALTSGFREMFGLSVHDFLQKIRMERAYELLQDDLHSIGWVAEAVGYNHPCNFSTAFHAYFGCTPQSLRKGLPS